MISLHSGLVGPHGYSADSSRSWICGRQSPADDQKQLYQLAHELVQLNTELFKAGRSNRDIGTDAWQLPESFQQNQLPGISHGIGQCNEYPIIMNSQWFESSGQDGECQADIIFCVESYVGSVGGSEGVKLEQ